MRVINDLICTIALKSHLQIMCFYVYTYPNTSIRKSELFPLKVSLIYINVFFVNCRVLLHQSVKLSIYLLQLHMSFLHIA